MQCKECEDKTIAFNCSLCDKEINDLCLECHLEIAHDLVDYTPSSCNHGKNALSGELSDNHWDDIVKQFEKDNT